MNSWLQGQYCFVIIPAEIDTNPTASKPSWKQGKQTAAIFLGIGDGVNKKIVIQLKLKFIFNRYTQSTTYRKTMYKAQNLWLCGMRGSIPGLVGGISFIIAMALNERVENVLRSQYERNHCHAIFFCPPCIQMCRWHKCYSRLNIGFLDNDSYIIGCLLLEEKNTEIHNFWN